MICFFFFSSSWSRIIFAISRSKPKPRQQTVWSHRKSCHFSRTRLDGGPFLMTLQNWPGEVAGKDDAMHRNCVDPSRVDVNMQGGLPEISSLKISPPRLKSEN